MLGVASVHVAQLVPQLRKRIFIVGSLHSPVAPPDPMEFALDAYGIDAAMHDNGTGAALLDLGDPTPKKKRAAYRSEGSTFSSIMRGALDEVDLHERPQ